MDMSLSEAVIALESHFETLLKNKWYIVNVQINKQLLFFVSCWKGILSICR